MHPVLNDTNLLLYPNIKLLKEEGEHRPLLMLHPDTKEPFTGVSTEGSKTYPCLNTQMLWTKESVLIFTAAGANLSGIQMPSSMQKQLRKEELYAVKPSTEWLRQWLNNGASMLLNKSALRLKTSNLRKFKFTEY
jgi:hypothetical protein